MNWSPQGNPIRQKGTKIPVNPIRQRGNRFPRSVKPLAYASGYLLLLMIVVMSTASAEDSATIFSEDFSAGSSVLKKWKGKNRDSWKVDELGVLIGENTSDGYGIGIGSPKFAQKNLRASFRFKMIDAKGVQFKLNYVGGGHIGRFILQPNGFFFQANKNRPLDINEARNFETLNVSVEPSQWHELEIKLIGDEITGTLDGQSSKTYQYQHLKNEMGQFELSVMGKSAAFDDVVIYPYHPKERSAKGNPKRKRGTKPTSDSDISAILRSNAGLPKTDLAWAKPLQSFFDANCNDCHGEGADEGGFELSSLDGNLSDAETMRRWVLLYDRVNKGEMPPQDYDRPDADDQQAFLKTLHSQLTTTHAANREVVLRRLNRVEYENTINDLFGIDIRLAEMLPEDAKKHGFDNNGEALALSSELIEVYLEAASLVLDRAIGPKVQPERISISKTVRELVHDNMYSRWFKLMEIDDGTVIYSSEFGAGSQFTGFKIPSEGTYRFRFHARAYQSDEPVMMQVQSGIVTRSGTKRFLGFHSVPPAGRVVELTDYMFPRESLYPRPFGTIKNISGFLKQGKRKIEEYDGSGLVISKVEVEGPLEPWPPKSRSKLLADVDLVAGTADDAEVIFKRFLPRAFRRPVRKEELAKYVDKVHALIESGRSFEDSLRWTLRAALCSPEFLFLEEPQVSRRVSAGQSKPETRSVSEGSKTHQIHSLAHASGYQEINDFALANRLSYFLWSSMPDEQLMALAATGKLRDPAIFREQTERMLRDEKSKSLTKGFVHQWLGLRDIDATSPDTKLYPEFDEYLKQSMVEETERFFEEVLHKNESLRSFIDSDWVVVNERLSRHYGIEGVTGEEFRRVKLPAGHVRGGLMTQASILKVTANGANTSPVTRGVWMLENMMGIRPPPPPPNVPAVVPDVTGANTLRQLLETHRGEESCNSCHRLIDPPGFALEEFDAIGAWRKKYQFQGSRKLLPVDSSGVTPRGDSFKGVRDYRKLVMKEIDQVTYGLADKLMTYATGRGMGFSDREELNAIVARSRVSDYRFRDLIHEIVQSAIFRSP